MLIVVDMMLRVTKGGGMRRSEPRRSPGAPRDKSLGRSDEGRLVMLRESNSKVLLVAPRQNHVDPAPGCAPQQQQVFDLLGTTRLVGG